ncbi:MULTISPECIES: hypothetical protein [unclassified Microbacterium]|uniref:hypothetical protein n=1 Tax=unclassified Microbacterium TaxID=2609290 RepID=UPI00068C54F4|nr:MULTISPECIES: hypothetical protein [unclassified Microbacterium]
MTVRKVGWVSPARFGPFLAACDGDNDLAWNLYEWNAKVASALFECFHHTEVLLRNSMMSRLSTIHPLAYPWQQGLDSVVKAAERRMDATTKAAAPDAIISELTLGFWTNLLEQRPANEELWRQHLRHVFPGSPGTREAVHKSVTDMRNLRNRCAHQDSLLDFDPGIELKKLLSLVEWIDPEARIWLEGIESVSAVASSRPVAPARDVVIVAATAERQTIDMYDRVSAYVCASDRSIAQVTQMGFYVNKQIEPYFPTIEEKIVPARWNRDESKRLLESGSPVDQRLGKVMAYGLKNGWPAGEQVQVFLLSDKRSDTTTKRASPIAHEKSGRGSAFVKNPRYFARAALIAATDTAHLG